MSASMRLKRVPLAAGLLVALCAALPLSADARTLSTRLYSRYGGFAIEPGYLETADGGATALVRAPAISFGPGQTYRVSSCLQVHVSGAAPAARCAERTIDTHGQTTAKQYAAATVSLPVSGATSVAPAWASGRLDISYLAGKAWTPVASTLPDGAGIPPSIDLRPGTAGAEIATPSQGVNTGTGTGGINTAGMDSWCMTSATPATTALPAGVSANQFPGAPAYSEVGQPLGTTTPKGVALVLHGGAWATVGTGEVEKMRPDADRWRKRGWLTVNSTYRGCADSLTDVRWFVDQIRTRYPGLPLCIVGASAGAHLALMMASQLGSAVDCVEGEGAPTELDRLLAQSATSGTSGTRPGYNVAVAAFGQENLARYSPSPAAIHAHVLLAIAASDDVIPFAQETDFRTAMLAADPSADVSILQLAAGTTPWVHGSVTSAALASLSAREDALAAAAIASAA